MPGRVLTQRQLNRAVLARQLLLERSGLPLTRALEHVAGLQTQYAPSGYVGLWSRLADFERDDLTRALERRSVVQATLMRTTIHLVSAHDYPLLRAATRDARREHWLKARRGKVDARELEAGARRVQALLADGPRRRDELVEVAGGDAMTWNGVGVFIDLVRAPPSGTWEHRRADLYATADQWLGPPDVTRKEAVEHLVRRYLGAFGPARPREIADWAGLELPAVVDGLDGPRLRRFRDEDGRELVDLERAPLPDPETPAPVRFLPTWDATLLVHARRTGILPEQHRQRVFSTKTPHSVGTFLVDGAVAGTWHPEHGRIVTKAFTRLPRDVKQELDEEAERLAAFHSGPGP
jgi:Winged helix DNA-binding domain